jgi:hypothetical protein
MDAMITVRFSNLYIKMLPGIRALGAGWSETGQPGGPLSGLPGGRHGHRWRRALPSVFRGQVHDIAAGYQWPYLADYQVLDSSERGVLPQPHR